MADFSTMLQTPEVRQLTQEKFLEKQWHDGLFPELMFRNEAQATKWDASWGDEVIRTGTGFIKPDVKPLRPGTDPVPTSYDREQWSATKRPYGQTIDEHMPTSASALASMILDKAKKMAVAAAQSMNRKVRQVLYNTAVAGHTTADGAQAAVTTLRVTSLNGFTRARRPDLAQGSPVRYEAVSSTNPLKIKVYDTSPAEVSRTVTGYTPDIAGDEQGPGTLTLNAAVTVSDRAYVIADDRTNLIRVGGGKKVDDVGASDLLTFADVRSMVSRFQTSNVPTHPDGRYHCHIDPISVAQLYGDAEWQRLLTGVPDYLPYKNFTLGEVLNCIFYRNNEVPQDFNVQSSATGDAPTGFSDEEYNEHEGLAAEVFTAGGVKVHRPLFTGFGGLIEYFEDFDNQVTEAGLQGVKMSTSVQNNGINVMADRTWLMLRAPQNRMQDMVALTWKFAGDFVFRTDGATGGAARYKRVGVIEHGEAA